MLFTDLGRHFARYDGLDRIRVFGHSALFFESGEDVVEKEGTHLVAGDAAEFAVLVARHNADTVTVGVGRNDQVGRRILHRDLDAFRKRCRIFRIRLCETREVSVGGHLAVDGMEVLHADAAENFGNDAVARTAERSVNNVQFVCRASDDVRINLLADDVVHEDFIEFRADHRDEGFVRLVTAGNTCENVGGVDEVRDVVRHILGRLCAVFPVELVAVVGGRVVGRGDVDARDAAEVAHTRGEHGGRAEFIKQINLDSVRGQDFRTASRIECGVVAAVAADDDAAFLFVSAEGFNGTCHTFGRLCNGVHVHHCAAGAHLGTQTAGTEFHVGTEPELDFVFVVCDCAEFRFGIFVYHVGFQPFEVSLLVIFHNFISFRHFVSENVRSVYRRSPKRRTGCATLPGKCTVLPDRQR